MARSAWSRTLSSRRAITISHPSRSGWDSITRVSMKQGLLTISAYIEGFYNRERRHTTLGNLSPADYESQHAAVCLA
jgi:putative transposase